MMREAWEEPDSKGTPSSSGWPPIVGSLTAYSYILKVWTGMLAVKIFSFSIAN